MKLKFSYVTQVTISNFVIKNYIFRKDVSHCKIFLLGKMCSLRLDY